jgi:MoaA/NifB/PqqE/SkfB family radical SAM enzyme
MNIDDIGFYTLSEARCAKENKEESNLERCELILTDSCNFSCPYCRGIRDDISGTMPIREAVNVVKFWGDCNLRNIRFSGGEPTLYKDLPFLVELSKHLGIERIAVSTNGSASYQEYRDLLKAGVNDFSISLDACCSSTGDMMTGRKGMWDNTVDTIRFLAAQTYVTIGVVYNEKNIDEIQDIIKFGSSLGVADVRIIPSAQFNRKNRDLSELPQDITDKHPILRYRLDNILGNRDVRGISTTDSHKCDLVLDDMAVAGRYHFPCIIYMREGGDPIGIVNKTTRKDRFNWYMNHNTYDDPICRENCLDVCVDHNNKCANYASKTT